VVGAYEAVLEACRLRLRPMFMTSLGVHHGRGAWCFSTGAGSEMRQAIGMRGCSSNAGRDRLRLVLTPVFYVVIQKFAGPKADIGRQIHVGRKSFNREISTEYERDHLL